MRWTRFQPSDTMSWRGLEPFWNEGPVEGDFQLPPRWPLRPLRFKARLEVEGWRSTLHSDSATAQPLCLSQREEDGFCSWQVQLRACMHAFRSFVRLIRTFRESPESTKDVLSQLVTFMATSQTLSRS